jgi:hypothetical protein
MLFSLQSRQKCELSRRSRLFIRIHHLAVISLITWIGYLFTVREIL